MITLDSAHIQINMDWTDSNGVTQKSGIRFKFDKTNIDNWNMKLHVDAAYNALIRHVNCVFENRNKVANETQIS